MYQDRKIFPSCPWPRQIARHWLLIRANYRRDLLAEFELAYAGYLVFRPCYRVSERDRKRNRQWITVERSLFPGYLFVHCAGIASFSHIENQRGVREIVRIGRTPAFVPDVLVEELHIRAGINFGERYRSRGAAKFKPGDKVRITYGPFAGYLGRIDDLDDEDRITLLIDLLGRLTPIVGLEADQVEGEPC